MPDTPPASRGSRSPRASGVFCAQLAGTGAGDHIAVLLATTVAAALPASWTYRNARL
ncbi:MULTISPECIES: hypothetical protein [Pseudonocardia]|uniref:hypothetical protein n=1 Tax=Pseudonocardia TaxID=1847 RepID=UPI0013028555|nr:MULTISPECIES: hypothetical protein [Pseudonocardia]